MYTGTMIEELIASVVRAEEYADDRDSDDSELLRTDFFRFIRPYQSMIGVA